MLRSLLSADGVTPHMITVFIDGYFEVSFYIYGLSLKMYLNLYYVLYLLAELIINLVKLKFSILILIITEQLKGVSLK